MIKSCPEIFCSKLLRKKNIPIKGSEDSSPLKRSLTLFDMCMYGIGAMCGGYIYGVSIVLVATKSGATSFVSNIIAGLVAALNAQCYVELSSRLPSGGGGYNFTYMICGELLAFIAGWAMLLEYLLGFTFASIGAANAIDMLSNNTINNAIVYYIGHFPNTHGYLGDTANILAALISIAIIILLAFGAKISIGINNVITLFSTLVLLICAIYMAIYSNFWHLSSHRFINNTAFTGVKSDWLPFGFYGIIGGAALTFDAFIGFDALALNGDLVIDPRRNVPLSTNISIILVFAITTFYYLCISFYVPWFMVNPKLGLSGLFYNQKIFSMQIIASIGEIAGYITSAFANMFALSHIVFSLSTDGLLFPFFHFITSSKQVPIITNLIFGFLAATMALIFDLNIIANFMSAGTIITYTIVSIDLLIIRLINLDNEELNMPNAKVATTFSIKDISFTPSIENVCDSSRRIKRPSCLISSLSILIISCVIASQLSNVTFLNIAGKFSILSICLFFSIISCIVLFLFKYYIPEEGFKVKPVPFVPLLCIILNIILASHLQIIVWGRICIWLILGLLCYMFYGVWHSKLNFEDEESTSLIRKDSIKSEL